MNSHTNRRLLLATTAVASLASLALATAAEAQSNGNEVVVTGSRIARKDYVSDTPIVSVGQKALEVTGSVTVESLINQLPQVVP